MAIYEDNLREIYKGGFDEVGDLTRKRKKE